VTKRILIDTMVVDLIADTPGSLDLVQEAVRRGALSIPRQISLETEDYFTSRPHQFRLKAVHRDAGEAWYGETRKVRTDQPR